MYRRLFVFVNAFDARRVRERENIEGREFFVLVTEKWDIGRGSSFFWLENREDAVQAFRNRSLWYSLN